MESRFMFRAIMPTYREALMNELWMWDYEGKTEWGKIEEPQKGDYPLIILDCKPDKYGVTTYRRDRSHVTNLRPAQVNPADAVVIEGVTKEEIKLVLECANASMIRSYYQHGSLEMLGISKAILDQITPPEPKKTLLTQEQK